MAFGATRILAVVFFLGFLSPVPPPPETCSLYQRWQKDHGLGACQDFPESSYFEVTPTGGSGTFFARKVPKCKDGTEDGCASIEIKSLDGTRPFYFIDPPDLGVEHSNRWVIAFEGGGSCGAMRGDNAATACMIGTQDPSNDYAFNGYSITTSSASWYDADYKEMTTRHPEHDDFGQPIYTIPNQIEGKGILDPDASNVFSTYNRVLVNKSSFDRFMGNLTTTPEPYSGDNIELYFHGRRIISAMFKDLARVNGVITVGTNCPNYLPNNCQTVEDFSAATEVVVVGESGGAGGLVHNMEFIKGAILNRAPNAKVVFLLASRMIPWLEAEAHWSSSGGIWSDVYSGTSTIYGNPGNTPDATATFNSAAFQPGGVVRELLKSWGRATSTADPYLDSSCKAAHGSSDWRCFDEGHVALYHMDEDVFWFESLFDGVHARSSPLSFVPTADFGNGPVDLSDTGGFIFDPPGTWNFSQDRGNRVIYTSDEMLRSHGGAGVLGFYQPAINCHTTVYSPAFWSDTLTKNGGNVTSLQMAFLGWLDAIVAASPQDRAWVQDALSTDPVTWSNGIYGGGWSTGSGTCPQ